MSENYFKEESLHMLAIIAQQNNMLLRLMSEMPNVSNSLRKEACALADKLQDAPKEIIYSIEATGQSENIVDSPV